MENSKIELSLVEMDARRLSYLLYSSKMPEEVKNSWLTLLPEMSKEQILKFIDILEGDYLETETKEIDEEYKEKIKIIIDDFEKKKTDMDKQLINDIKKIQETID